MKISTKLILSPGRAGGRDPPFSLTTSLSRRLRTNQSIKGAASPAMFLATGKKRGGGFENQEPSSPKVTCIGQVRIKSKKKQGKQLRSLSRRHFTGDVSFRKLERTSIGSSYHRGGDSFGSNQEHFPKHRNNQRWVHLSLMIYEALRTFGSEFSCLFPCRTSCFSPDEGEKVEKTMAKRREEMEGERQRSGSCAKVFMRRLVAFHDRDDGGRGSRRDIELMVGDDSEDDRSFRCKRTKIPLDLTKKTNKVNVKNQNRYKNKTTEHDMIKNSFLN